MSAYVLHDNNGQAQSIATGTPPSPLPAGLAAKVITDADFTGLTSGTHRWDPPTRTVLLDTAKQTAAANEATVRQNLDTALALLQQIIDTPQVSFSNVAGAQTSVRSVQQQVKDLARVQRGVIRLVLGRFDGTD